jgi:hypothetical protein
MIFGKDRQKPRNIASSNVLMAGNHVHGSNERAGPRQVASPGLDALKLLAHNHLLLGAQYRRPRTKNEGRKDCKAVR